MSLQRHFSAFCLFPMRRWYLAMLATFLSTLSNLSETLQENRFKLESFHSGTIMQTAGGIYLTFSQLLNHLEIIDSPSAMIKMERLNEETGGSRSKAGRGSASNHRAGQKRLEGFANRPAAEGGAGGGAGFKTPRLRLCLNLGRSQLPGLKPVGMSSLPRRSPSASGSAAAAAAVAEGLVLGLTAVEGERAPLDDTFYDLAVRPTSPAWRGEEDEEAKASSGDIGSPDYQEFVVDIESRLRMEGVELKEEWQDEDFPIPLPEDDSIEADVLAVTGPESQPGSLEVNGNKVRKKLMAPDISLTLDPSDGSVLSDDLDESGEIDLDGLDTPSEDSNEFEWEDDLPKPKTTEVIRKGSITEYTAAEEKEDGRRWRMFRIGEQDHRVDMKAIEPYKKVISHGGYYGDGLNAIVVFAVCFMPESGQPNYRYLMDNLFKYVIGTLELLVAENYMIVYLNGATTRRKMPSLGWLRKCYQQIDRRLRKNLKSLIIVHPSWFIRTLLAVTRPFISSKFSQKIRYVFNLAELAELVPMEYVGIPECIKQYEEEKLKKKQKRVDQELNGKQDEPKNEQ
ncbi:BCL2/adenovirus E1B 19 kDa protein-interacting protein 2 [Sus scrofa]|nr:BCL2/adenovirus E1B 19 kDa protein-interacting protein 2 [Sus scrofa]